VDNNQAVPAGITFTAQGVDQSAVLGQLLIGNVGLGTQVGSFLVQFSNSQTKPLPPEGGASASLRSQSFSVTNNTATTATQTIQVGDIGYNTTSIGSFNVLATTSGTFSSANPLDKITINNFIDGGNNYFGTGTLIENLTFTPTTGNLSYADTKIISFGPVNPYALTTTFTITLAPGETLTGRNNVIEVFAAGVPEPATLLSVFLGAPFLGARWLRRRRAVQA